VCFWKYCHYGCGSRFANEESYNSHIHTRKCDPTFVEIPNKGLLGIAKLPPKIGDRYKERADLAYKLHIGKGIWDVQQ
jgi:hypothetical protein